MESGPVTMVANSVHRHDQSIGLEIYDSDTALRQDWNEAALRHAGNTSVVVFVEENSLSVLAVHLAKIWRKYHLSDVAGKCTDQSGGHEWHHTTRLRKSDVGSCFRQFHEDYHTPQTGFYCIVDSIAGNKMLRIIWGLELIQRKIPTDHTCPQMTTRKRTTPANSQLSKKHQQRCSVSQGYKFSGHTSQKMHPSRWRTLQATCLSVERRICNCTFNNIAQ